jgi:hypothetical protein
MRRGPTALTVTATILALAVAGCGEEPKRYSDDKIIDKLNLEKLEGETDFTMKDDVFCVVSKQLLNTADEVEAASDDKDTRSLVVASREGNVGIVGVPIFPNDCQETVRKKLSRLDVPTAEEG